MAVAIFQLPRTALLFPGNMIWDINRQYHTVFISKRYYIVHAVNRPLEMLNYPPQSTQKWHCHDYKRIYLFNFLTNFKYKHVLLYIWTRVVKKKKKKEWTLNLKPQWNIDKKYSVNIIIYNNICHMKYIYYRTTEGTWRSHSHFFIVQRSYIILEIYLVSITCRRDTTCNGAKKAWDCLPPENLFN